jgi:mono/diheme cytochrome c family protein
VPYTATSERPAQPPKERAAPAPGHEKINSVIVRVSSLVPALLLVLAVLAATPAFSSGKTEADEKAGAVLFRDKGCAYCHGVGGIGTKKAPSLVDLRKDKLWPPAKITNQILNGGQKMPPFSDSLTDQEIAQLVAYLRAKHRPVPPPGPTPAPAS